MQGMLYLIRPACLSGINRFKIGYSHDHVVANIEKDSELFCVQGNLHNGTQIEQALIDMFNDKFVRITDRIYEGNIHTMIDVFRDTISFSKSLDDSQDMIQLKKIAFDQVGKFYTKHANMPHLKQSGYITFAACKQFRESLDIAISQAGLQYCVSKETTHDNISKFILFHEPMLQFISNA